MEVLNVAGLSFVGTLTSKTRLGWLGHVKRTPDRRILMTVLYSEARAGSRERRQALHGFRDACKGDSASFGTSVADWEGSAECCSGWRTQLADERGAAGLTGSSFATTSVRGGKNLLGFRASLARGWRALSVGPVTCVGFSSHQRTHQRVRHAL